MVIIGLTGSVGTGKSTVAAMFNSHGIKVVNADNIVHKLISPEGKCYKAVLKSFGEKILSGRKIDHKRLGRIVFNDFRKLRTLEKILHPQVRRDIEQIIRKCQKGKRTKILVIEVPLLLEAGMENLVDIVMTVQAKQEQQIQRLKTQGKLTQSQILRRIKLQMPLKEKMLLSDIIIDNRDSKNKTKKQVKAILKSLNTNHKN